MSTTDETQPASVTRQVRALRGTAFATPAIIVEQWAEPGGISYLAVVADDKLKLPAEPGIGDAAALKAVDSWLRTHKYERVGDWIADPRQFTAVLTDTGGDQ